MLLYTFIISLGHGHMDMVRSNFNFETNKNILYYVNKKERKNQGNIEDKGICILRFSIYS